MMIRILFTIHIIFPSSILSGQLACDASAWDAPSAMRVSNITIILLKRKPYPIAKYQVSFMSILATTLLGCPIYISS